MLFDFLYNLCLKYFLFQGEFIDFIIHFHRFLCKSGDYSYQILIKFEFYQQIFEKSSSNQFRENPQIRPVRSELFHAEGRKGRQP
jgi:hypothetical protein